jgi:hypothetical protein
MNNRSLENLTLIVTKAKKKKTTKLVIIIVVVGSNLFAHVANQSLRAVGGDFVSS